MLCKIPQDFLSFFMVMKKCLWKLMGRAYGWGAARGMGGSCQHTEFLHLKCRSVQESLVYAQLKSQTLPLLLKMVCKQVSLL